MRTGWFYILGVTLLFWVTQPALAERHAIVVGVNQGPSPLVPLRYAHDDARKIEEILRELGGVPKSNMRLLLEPDLEELQSMLWTTTSAAKPGDELFFYYSGHADDQGLSEELRCARHPEGGFYRACKKNVGARAFVGRAQKWGAERCGIVV